MSEGPRPGRDFDAAGLVGLALSTLLALHLAPALSLHALGDPAFAAMVATALVFCRIVVLRARHRRGTRRERFVLSAFLALMPAIYVLCWLRFDRTSGWIWPELLGLLGFSALAVLGLRGSPWWLVAGIAGHGLLWDTWHYGRAPFIPDWYAVACTVVDLAWAFYAAAQVRAWNEPRPPKPAATR
jgi:hypothetical protein